MRKIIYSTKPIFINYFFKKINIGQKLTSYIKPNPPIPKIPSVYDLKAGDIYEMFRLNTNMNLPMPDTDKTGIITFDIAMMVDWGVWGEWMSGFYVKFEDGKILLYSGGESPGVVREQDGTWNINFPYPLYYIRVRITSNTLPNIKSSVDVWGFQDSEVDENAYKPITSYPVGYEFKYNSVMALMVNDTPLINVNSGKFIVGNAQLVWDKDTKRLTWFDGINPLAVIYDNGIWTSEEMYFAPGIVTENTLPITTDGSFGFQNSLIMDNFQN